MLKIVLVSGAVTLTLHVSPVEGLSDRHLRGSIKQAKDAGEYKTKAEDEVKDVVQSETISGAKDVAESQAIFKFLSQPKSKGATPGCSGGEGNLECNDRGPDHQEAARKSPISKVSKAVGVVNHMLHHHHWLLDDVGDWIRDLWNLFLTSPTWFQILIDVTFVLFCYCTCLSCIYCCRISLSLIMLKHQCNRPRCLVMSFEYLFRRMSRSLRVEGVQLHRVQQKMEGHRLPRTTCLAGERATVSADDSTG